MDLCRTALRAVVFMTPWVLLLILALMLLRRFLHRRISPRFFHLAWLILALRLAIPFDLSLPNAPVFVPLPDAVQSSAAFENAAVPQEIGEGSDAPAPPSALTAQTSPAASDNGIRLVHTVVPVVWAGGAAVFFLFHFSAYLLFMHKLRKTRTAASDPIHCEAKKAFGHPVRVYCSCAVQSPMLAGLFSPAVYLPAQGAAGDSLPYILAHEAAHARHGDTRTQFLILLAQSFHWFDPAVHLLARAAREDMEESCDEAVLFGQDILYRQSYASAVLNVLKASSRHGSAPVFSTAFTDGTSLKRRFCEMFSSSPKKRGTAALTALALLVAGISTLVGCGFTAASVVPLKAESVQKPVFTDTADKPQDADPFAPQQKTHGAETAPSDFDSAFVFPFADSVDYSISAPFTAHVEDNSPFAPHSGIDFAAEEGTEIRAISAGRAEIEPPTENAFECGRYLTVTQGDTTVLYAHCSRILVKDGEAVKPGDVIALVGSTGNATGAHLHLEVRKNGTPIDPSTVLSMQGALQSALSE